MSSTTRARSQLASFLEPVASLSPCPDDSSGPSLVTEPKTLETKSRVVFDAQGGPPEIAFLEKETDLNKVPSNWLQKNDKLIPLEAKGATLDVVPGGRGTGGEVAKLATTELVSTYEESTEVEFIAPVDNVKKLFKLPYSKAPVSMAVHRIGSTLILDGFAGGAPYHAAAGVEAGVESTPGFLFGEHPAGVQSSGTSGGADGASGTSNSSSGGRGQRTPFGIDNGAHFLPFKKKNPQKRAERALYSKFLYYSVGDSNESVTFEEVSVPSAAAKGGGSPKGSSRGHGQHHVFASGSGSAAGGPRAGPSSSSPGSQATTIPEFTRTFHWQFKDTSMLLGSNMLIFSRDGHPSVSLKLQNVERKITSLAALDYWIDNVICDVPELCICYHKNGFVQGYQLVQTPDIPSLSNHGFHPHVVEESAYHVLKFLKENCTKDGGTYWLFRDEEETDLRLYDVTQGSNDVAQRFAFPIAMLCFRVATNLSSSAVPEDIVRAQGLFRKCIDLLESEERPQIWAAAQDRLADTYLQRHKSLASMDKTVWDPALEKPPSPKRPPPSILASPGSSSLEHVPAVGSLASPPQSPSPAAPAHPSTATPLGLSGASGGSGASEGLANGSALRVDGVSGSSATATAGTSAGASSGSSQWEVEGGGGGGGGGGAPASRRLSSGADSSPSPASPAPFAASWGPSSVASAVAAERAELASRSPSRSRQLGDASPPGGYADDRAGSLRRTRDLAALGAANTATNPAVDEADDSGYSSSSSSLFSSDSDDEDGKARRRLRRRQQRQRQRVLSMGSATAAKIAPLPADEAEDLVSAALHVTRGLGVVCAALAESDSRSSGGSASSSGGGSSGGGGGASRNSSPPPPTSAQTAGSTPYPQPNRSELVRQITELRTKLALIYRRLAFIARDTGNYMACLEWIELAGEALGDIGSNDVSIRLVTASLLVVCGDVHFALCHAWSEEDLRVARGSPRRAVHAERLNHLADCLGTAALGGEHSSGTTPSSSPRGGSSRGSSRRGNSDNNRDVGGGGSGDCGGGTGKDSSSAVSVTTSRTTVASEVVSVESVADDWSSDVVGLGEKAGNTNGSGSHTTGSSRSGSGGGHVAEWTAYSQAKRSNTRAARLLRPQLPLSLEAEANLTAAASFYEVALLHVSATTNPDGFAAITRRLGNARNELGNLYMAEARYTKAAAEWARGKDSFNSVNDVANMALLSANLGRLLRVMAHEAADTSRPMSEVEEDYYQRSIEYYVEARDVLGSRRAHPPVWDSINTQLGGTHLSFAVRLQDKPPLAICAPEDVEKTISSQLQKALKCYELAGNEGRVLLTHYQLGKFYVEVCLHYPTVSTDKAERTKSKLARFHLEKVIDMYEELAASERSRGDGASVTSNSSGMVGLTLPDLAEYPPIALLTLGKLDAGLSGGSRLRNLCSAAVSTAGAAHMLLEQRRAGEQVPVEETLGSAKAQLQAIVKAILVVLGEKKGAKWTERVERGKACYRDLLVSPEIGMAQVEATAAFLKSLPQ